MNKDMNIEYMSYVSHKREMTGIDSAEFKDWLHIKRIEWAKLPNISEFKKHLMCKYIPVLKKIPKTDIEASNLPKVFRFVRVGRYERWVRFEKKATAQFKMSFSGNKEEKIIYILQL